MDIVLTKRASYMVGKKGPSIPGMLMMTDSRFEWTSSDPRAAQPLNHPFSIIRAHFFSKGTKKAMLNLSKGPDAKADGFVFEFESFPDRDQCRDHVAKILANQNSSAGHQTRPPVATTATTTAPATAPPARPMSTPATQGGQVDNAEIERRMKLLQTDRDLQRLHSQLVVMRQIISEEEFWNSRKHMLEDDQSKAKRQRVGLKTSMLADVRPMTDGRTNKVTFNLTPEIIHQIFAEKPAVHRAFLMSVPAKMSVEQFWTKYCRAEYLYRTKNQAAAAAEAADDEDLALFTKEDDIITTESQRKIKKVDPTLDMAVDQADDYIHLPGHGIFRDGGKEPESQGQGPRKRTIMNDINRHAAVVLDGSPLDSTGKEDTASVAYALAVARQTEEDKDRLDNEKQRLERVHQMTLNEDLQGPQDPHHVPLCIQDPRKYFDSQPSGNAGEAASQASADSDPSEVLERFLEQLAAFKINGPLKSVMEPAVAFKVMTDLTKEISSTRYTLGKSAEKNVLDNLPPKIKDDILQQSAISNELLRHFWASYPLTSAALVSKANRLKDEMAALYTQIQATKDSAPPAFRHQISQLLHPVMQGLDAGFAHYDAQAQRRTSKTGTKPVHSAQQNGVIPPRPRAGMV